MSTDNTFLHTLSPTKHGGAGQVEYLIDGNAWWAYSNWSRDQLNLHIRRDGQLVMLKVSKTGGEFGWEYCREIADGVYIRIYGTAATADDAARDAFAFQPETRLRNGHVWYLMPADRWLSAIDGDECGAGKSGEHFYWWRAHATAKAVLKHCSGGALTGHTDSLDAAMDACTEAPAQLLHACREFIVEAERSESQAPAPADASIPQLRI